MGGRTVRGEDDTPIHVLTNKNLLEVPCLWRWEPVLGRGPQWDVDLESLIHHRCHMSPLGISHIPGTLLVN